ncbi:M28 family metallopeptidase [Mycobacterium sp. 852002-51057_SCH5723018]|uniref:M28 family metallopeptidase n=1 Tax=Mycobacterium sp. 852002-51057_SCH5723018 TaxID=1834094 RepID=UPI0008020101|nr:M28 family metallopeptidase [Mycobacterium sp. 852002-51057_SCH5723018]OBG30228.1 amidohydrolase [Mycobacterium sp. 852002-51057_SCH5723018]
MRSRRLSALAAVAVSVAALCGCGGAGDAAHTAASPTEAPAAFAATIRHRVTADAMMSHLTKLQQIADANGGNRAVGTPGYDASVDYVADALRSKGFDVRIPEFELRLPFADPPELTVGGTRVEAKPLEYTVGTRPPGVTGPLVPARVDDSPGCTAADYDGLTVAGAVVLVDRGKCPFADKQLAAAARGAVALIVADNVDGDQSGATLGEQTHVTIPVVSVSKTDGARLRSHPGTTTITLNAGVRVEKSRNVLAQTKTGSAQDVVMVGAHLDSVPAGPGIDDNGSGVAAVLETALQMGGSPPVHNGVRFAFWGAEEIGLVGSANYLQSLDVDALKDIALYLNFDMLASPNPAYFTYDGDQSAPRDPQQAPPRVPEGSAGIERTLVAYLKSAGKTAQDVSLEGRSDHDGFTRAGIPSGGIFSGAESEMTAEQARLWGGTANQPYDPNYHQKTDTIDHINRSALDINGGGAAYTVALYAQDLGGRNGVPVRDDRTRHVVTKP